MMSERRRRRLSIKDKVSSLSLSLSLDFFVDIFFSKTKLRNVLDAVEYVDRATFESYRDG